MCGHRLPLGDHGPDPGYILYLMEVAFDQDSRLSPLSVFGRLEIMKEGGNV